MEHRPLLELLTPQQVHNLELLADFLEKTPPPAFDMRTFAYSSDGDPFTGYDLDDLIVDLNDATVPEEHKCGTVCCVAGIAAYAGIRGLVPEFAPEAGDNWDKFVFTKFGFGDGDFGRRRDYMYRRAGWSFLFDSEWAHVDNTIPGAVKRIRYILEHGIPDMYSVQEMLGYSRDLPPRPLCYDTSHLTPKT